MIKARNFPDENYKAIYHNFKTIRLAHDSSKPINALSYPEFYDVKITNYCSGGCDYCYQDSIQEDHYPNVVEKIKDFFGPMTENQRPFQVAIGGGNPNEHPDFIEILKTFHDLGITPNYTTNGIGLTAGKLAVTRQYCGGVAITCHPHLNSKWELAVERCILRHIRTNFHILISSKDDVNNFVDIYDKYRDDVEYFVLLPLLPQGRAEGIDYDLNEIAKYTIQTVEDLNTDQVAFGANFHPYLKGNKKLDLSLYEPEIFSAYLDLKLDTPMIYKSSFSDEERVIGEKYK